MKKINNKGFVLVEVLIVSTFVVSIFSIMYANFYPMMGEYEKRENYDDINSIYNAYLIKRLIENSNKSYPYYAFINNVYNSDIYSTIDPNWFTDYSVQEYYGILVKNLNIDQIYLIRDYKLKELKEKLNDFDDIQTREYIEYLPDYNNNPNKLGCRIIVRFKADANKESENNKSGEFKFATLGVDCK